MLKNSKKSINVTMVRESKVLVMTGNLVGERFGDIHIPIQHITIASVSII